MNNKKVLLFLIRTNILFLLLTMALITDFQIDTKDYRDRIESFAVDDAERVYLTRENAHEIEVYAENCFLFSIPSVTDRGYHFTIINNELVIETGENLYYLDLYGNVIEKYENSSFNGSKREWGKKCINSNGDVFLSTRVRGQYRIIKNNSVVIFEQPQDEGNAIYKTNIAKIVFYIEILVLGVLVFLYTDCYRNTDKLRDVFIFDEEIRQGKVIKTVATLYSIDCNEKASCVFNYNGKNYYSSLSISDNSVYEGQKVNIYFEPANPEHVTMNRNELLQQSVDTIRE